MDVAAGQGCEELVELAERLDLKSTGSEMDIDI
jgi:hypothetical protein